ncbi:MAG: sn-glycerol-3-phosphate ABC transporter ATP-binding protein UgpC [Alphaproteobacteria bacterium]|nr:sn-glycerol-3-phosphate ABC transporter ATP-binding protein UgpC [Alphaproteobacteria bacterium]
MATVSIKNLVKSYGKTEVLHGINLDVADGEFVVLVGPSGCGKSTTLRMIAGLEDITSGEIHIGGELVNHREPKERNIAMVFQNYAIYPHMSVRKNIGFGLRTSKASKAEKAARIDEVAELLSMTDLLDRRPNQLSGGQRQRVAIGRAMVRDPSAFLFDEPLSNLDAQLRTQMRLEIKKLHQRVGNTIIFVTHDQVEAMTMADRIVIMKDGHIQQVGTPYDVFHKPTNKFVAQFIGAPSMNMIEGSLADGIVTLEGGLQIPIDTSSTHRGPVTLGLRPDDLLVSSQDGQFEGQVNVLEPLGSETLVYVSVAGKELIAKASGRTPPVLGSTIKLNAAPENMHLFDSATGEALQ